MSTIKSLFPFLKLFKQQLGLSILGAVLYALALLSGIALLSLSGWFISAAAFTSFSYALAFNFNFFMPAAGVRFFSLLRIVSRYGERVTTHEATFKILSHVRVWFYEKLEPLAPAHLLKNQSGDLLTRMVNDIDSLDNLYLRILVPSLMFVLVALLVLVFFGFFNWPIAFLAFGASLFTAFFIPLLISLLSKKTSRQITHQQARLKTRLLDYYQGMRVLKSFNQSGKALEDIEQESLKLIQLQQRMAFFSGLGNALIAFALGTTLLLVTWLAVVLTHAHQINGVFIALFALGLIALFEAIGPLPQAYQLLGQTVSAAKRLLEIVQQVPAVTFKNNDDIVLEHYDIEFDQISFTYPAQGSCVASRNSFNRLGPRLREDDVFRLRKPVLAKAGNDVESRDCDKTEDLKCSLEDQRESRKCCCNAATPTSKADNESSCVATRGPLGSLRSPRLHLNNPFEQGDGDSGIFKDFSLSIKTGDKIAITGETGAGKSTLAQLLARCWDVQAGSIRIGGIDIQAFSEKQLRNLVTVLSQRPHIFSASIRDNLLLGNESANDKQLWKVLALVDLESFVRSLPQGLTTWTGENGQALSGGQRKRLALARALLRNTPIIVLDEPGEGLDNRTLETILNRLRSALSNKTIILITHNLQLTQLFTRCKHLSH